MSTRSTIHFHDGDRQEPTAIIYRHYDGYPEGMQPDLERFFKDVTSQTNDTRFGDASYLAAKYVVWQAGEYANDPTKPLAFLGVGVLQVDPSDIEYRWHIWCGKENPLDPAVPHITYEEVTPPWA